MRELAVSYIRDSVAAIDKLLADPIVITSVLKAADATARALLAGGKLLIAGNGGSAADAQHLAAEFVSRLTIDRPAMRAIALTTDSSILTALANDYGYEIVISRQIEAIGNSGDVFLAISTSGNSPNIVKAVAKARDLRLTTIGLTGRDGGQLSEACDHSIRVPSDTTARIQECHLLLEHTFCALVERHYFGTEYFGDHLSLRQ